MAADAVPARKALPLEMQILHCERRLLERRRNVMDGTARVRRAMRARLASPAMLAGAAGLGFALERMTQREDTGEHGPVRDAQPHVDLLESALRLSRFVRGLSRIFP